MLVTFSNKTLHVFLQPPHLFRRSSSKCDTTECPKCPKTEETADQLYFYLSDFTTGPRSFTRAFRVWTLLAFGLKILRCGGRAVHCRMSSLHPLDAGGILLSPCPQLQQRKMSPDTAPGLGKDAGAKIALGSESLLRVEINQTEKVSGG